MDGLLVPIEELRQAEGRITQLEAEKVELTAALDNLRAAAYWVTEGGEFYTWVERKSMPLAAAKELEELLDMTTSSANLLAKLKAAP